MPIFIHRPIGRRLLVLAALISIAGVVPAAAQAPDRQKQVLVLYSTRRDSQIVVVADRELQRLFARDIPNGVDYYSEHFDQARFMHADYEAAFRDSLRLRYQLQRFDVVIAIGSIPLEFIERNRTALFKDSAVVFFADHSPPRRIANSTGLIVPLDLRSSLSLAAALQPDLQTVYVITDTGVFEKDARSQFSSESRFAVTFLSGLPTKDLEARLATLPGRSAVYYINVNRDGADQNFRPLDYLDRLTAVANAPVYSWVDSAMEHGVLGGSLKDQAVEARTVGELAVRVLRGEPADSIPVASLDLNVNQVDWRQLRRWGISEARVPAGTTIKFREPSPWDRYKIYILGAVAALFAQTALIAGLIAQRARRRQAEEQVRGSEIALRTSYERIRDLGARLLKAQEGERARIARELHDDLGQQVALLEIDLELMGRVVHGETRSMVDDVLLRAHRIGHSMHDLSHRLHPAKLRLIGLVAALQSLRQELSQSGVTITFHHADVPARLPVDLTVCLFRIVQEALQNAIQHSGARTAVVELTGGTDLALTVVDDGAGFDVDAAWGKGLGLISMQERVEAIGGTFAIRSMPGSGTRVEVTVPSLAAQPTESASMMQ